MNPGARLGPYEIVAPIGAGGMGEVYRARDTKLNREVALKVLPEAFAADGALVMELVEGSTLAEKIAADSVDFTDEKLHIARQISEALEYAHEKGIIHRDLKPANIKITPDGQVKILDFGLAKALQESPDVADVENSPTLSMGATKAGVILGTAAYMAPEQARGKVVDKRADIWAFGVVLYEMLTGSRPFQGEDTSEILAAVIKEEPDWTAIPAGTPSAIVRLQRRCLTKDPRQRLQAIGEARIAIEEHFSNPAADVARSMSRTPSALPKYAWIALAALALAEAIALLAGWGTSHSGDVRLPLMRFPIDFGVEDLGWLQRDETISPDGTRIALISKGPDAKNRLYVYAFDRAEATPLAGTENARRPFFSPDSRWIGFVADGMLKKIPAQGGASIPLCSPDNENSPVFSPDGRWLAYTSDESGLQEVYVRPFPDTGSKWQVSTGGGILPIWSAEQERVVLSDGQLSDGQRPGCDGGTVCG